MFLGLGLTAGAIFRPAGAQVSGDTSRARADTSKKPVRTGPDSLITRDSSATSKPVGPADPSDTLRPPGARAPIPVLLPGDRALHLDRVQMFATGAITLQDLLSRVTLATDISAGYLSAPGIVTVAGDPRRVRVYYDGVEFDALDARSHGIPDLSQIQLWQLQDVTIERTAVELRVFIRSWQVINISPYTRTDIATGDQQTNLYRGFFGQRGGGGQIYQFAAQQYGTTPPRDLGASADQLALFGRFGWAGKLLSIDGTFRSVGRHRGDIRAFGRVDSLPGLESTRTDAYLRLGYANVDTSAFWGQVILSHSSYRFKPTAAVTAVTTTTTTPTTTTTGVDSIARDTTASEYQYVVAAGTNRGPLRLTLTARVRLIDTMTLVTPTLSGSYDFGRLFVRGTLEGRSADSLARSDIEAEASLLPWLRVSAAVDHASDSWGDSTTKSTSARLWTGVLVGGVWFDGGVVTRDSTQIVAPGLFGDSGIVAAPRATGQTLHIHGHVWRAFSVDASGLRWNDTAAMYRPQYQTRTEVIFQTNLPNRLPPGSFSLLVSARHEYRSATLFPSSAGALRASGERSISSLVEIRIYSAIVSWQVRNIAGSRNYEAPDYQRPRTVNFYGVRWEFWN